MSLKEKGFRFTYQKGRNPEYNWTHPADVTCDMIDTTEMTDDEFSHFVERAEAK